MSDLVFMNNGKIFASTVVIAEKFNKPHKTVLRNVRSIISNDSEFGGHNFVLTSYTTSQNKVHECFEMTRDGFAMLAMSFTGKEAMKWKVKYIGAFNKMESALIDVAPTLESVNAIVKKCESDKEIASECGSQLAKYKKIKKSNQEKLGSAIESVQMALGFKG